MMTQDMSVMLIDDDAHTRDIFQMVMAHHHIPFMVFDDAESAIENFPDSPPDVVVIDLFLPGMDGYQTLNALSLKPADSRVRYVATTAYHTNDTEEEILRRGFDGYLSKPFDSRKLATYLKKIVDS